MAISHMTIGSTGPSFAISSSGTDISVGTLYSNALGLSHAIENVRIENYSDGKISTILRMQYGYGDKESKALLEEILTGKTKLVLEEKTTEVTAQTTRDQDGRKTITMYTSGENQSIEELFMQGIILQHEAHRDGIVSDEQSQQIETINAVQAHTQMVEKLIKDPKYFKVMQEVIANNQDLQLDLLASKMGQEVFESYVGANYDSSADYWKMTWGGQLVSDGSGWLKDENGMYISKNGRRTTEPIPGETLGAEKQESGLLNIMNGESAQLYNTFSDEQKQQAQAIMESAGLEMDKTGQWNNALGKKVDMTDVMTVAGEKIADPVFETYYNNKVDYDLATAYGLDLKFSETAMNKTVPEVLQGKYSELMSQHMQETDSPAALMDKYTWSIYDKDGIATQLFKIDENNSFLDDLLGQHDFKGEKGSAEYTIDKWGCNFMTIISYSQLLAGQAFSKDQILDIWAQSAKLEYINEKDAFVQNRNNISLVAMQMLDLNDMYISFDNINFTNNYTPIGNRIGWLNSDGTPYHFSNGSIYNSNLYNPGYTIKPNYSTTPVKLWW